ncbi:MAG: hypothetical protein AAGA57_02655 [Planctomycetota bacterium]
MAPHTLSLRFGFDPRIDLPGGQAVIQWGPAAVGWLQALGVLAAAAGVWVALRAGAALRLGAVALLGTGGLGAAAWAWGGGFEDRQLAAGWLHAAAVGLAAVHLGQLPGARRWAVGLLLGLAIPVGLGAAYYVMVEGPASVRFAEQNAQALADARGQEDDSAAQRMLSRRTATLEATGTVGFSNVLGSMSTGLALIAVGCVAAAWRSRVKPACVAAAVALVAALAALACTSSRGAMAAAVGGAGVMAVLAWLARRTREGMRLRLAGAAPVGLVFAMQAAVGVSWLLGPDGPAGLRSLLFRGWYLETVVRGVREAPGRWLAGWGPDGVAQLSSRFKPELLPEEVASLHHAAADWLAALGVVGLAWGAALVLGAWRAGRNAVLAPARGPAGGDVRKVGLGVGAVALVWFGAEYAVANASFDLPKLGVWALGVAGFAAVAVLWLRGGGVVAEASKEAAEAVEVEQSPSPGADWVALGLTGAAAALVAHGLTEMTWFQPTCAPGAALIVGLAAAGSTAGRARDADAQVDPTQASRLWWGRLACAALVAASLLVAARFAYPAGRADRDLVAAERVLRLDPYAPQAIERLDRASARFDGYRLAERWAARLRLERVVAAAGAGEERLALREAEAAIAWAEDRAARRAGHGVALGAGDAWLVRSRVAPETSRESLDRAAQWYAVAMERSAGSVTAAQRRAEALTSAGYRAEAAEAWRELLRRDDLRRLDPERQFLPQQRQAIERRIVGLAPGG